MNFTIIHQEKKLPSFYTQAIKEYQKRLQRYCKIQLLSCSSDVATLKKSPQPLILSVLLLVRPPTHPSN